MGIFSIFKRNNKSNIDEDISSDEVKESQFYGDNMNLHKYAVKGIYSGTGRIRTVKIEAKSEDDAKNKFNKIEGMTFSSIELYPYDPPTERQIKYASSLGISIPQKCCKYDLSAIIHKHIEEDYLEHELKICPNVLADFIDFNFSRYSSEQAVCYQYYLKVDNVYEKMAFMICNYLRIIRGYWDFSDFDAIAEDVKSDIDRDKTLKNSTIRFDPDEKRMLDRDNAFINSNSAATKYVRKYAKNKYAVTRRG